MESAQQAEEELQQSVVVSEEDMGGDDISIADNKDTTSSLSPPILLGGCDDPAVRNFNVPKETLNGVSQHHQSSGVWESAQCGIPDDDDDDGTASLADGHTNRGLWSEERELRQYIPSDQDALDGPSTRSDSSASVVTVDDADDEAVGAVKIRPGEVEDEDEISHDSDTDITEDTESAAAWEDGDDGHGEGDDDSDPAVINTCIFCKQDEDNDPGEDFEELLECDSCGEYSHQLCARQANTIHDEHRESSEGPLSCILAHHGASGVATGCWRCPDCLPSETSNRQIVNEEMGSMPDVDNLASLGNESAKPDEQSGSIAERKRKTSASETSELPMSLRKRVRNTPDDRATSPSDTNSTGWPKSASEGDPSRRLRLKAANKKQSLKISRPSESLLVTLRVPSLRLQEILAPRPAGSRKRSTRPDASRARPDGGPFAPLPFLSAAVQPFYSFLDRDAEDARGKPFGGILSEANADTTKTLPLPEDRRRFDEAKQQAEEEWRVLQAADSALQRLDSRKKLKKSGGPASQIECIEFGGWEIDTWYAAPYPEEYSRNRTLYICEFCLKYMNSDYVAWRHKLKCPAKHPPGDEIYRHGSVSVFEVDGRKNPVYCQNLCLLAKLFLGSKTLYYDVEPFLFYVLCEHDDFGYHFVGYFSKEKRLSSQNNVSCILTLPIHQRKGYGNLLIDFSYLLTRVEQKTGSPEKPLSDMGLVSYRNYWRLVMCQYLLTHWPSADEAEASTGFSIRRISDDTGLTPDDVISALEGLRSLARDSQTGLYAFRVDLGYCQEYLSKWESKGYVKLHPDALTWTPYVMGRGNATNFELGPAITAIAPREEDDPKPLVVNATQSGTDELGSHDTMLIANSTECIAKTDGQTGGDSKRSYPSDEVRQSTEPSRLSPVPCQQSLQQGYTNMGRTKDQAAPQHWAIRYRDIPPTRFEVFPTLAGRRIDRPRNPSIRTSMARPAIALPRPRRPSGNANPRRQSTSRPKSNTSSRRKTGGTGRGPGRWPKGTKKSDYGNASSGPGLPPAWIKERQRLATIKSGGDGEASTSVDVSTTLDSVSVRFHNNRGSEEQEPHRESGNR